VVGSLGVEYKAFNYVTTKVPSDAPIGNSQTLLLFHTQDDYEPIVKTYRVLSQAPPGVFPPTSIVLPPPLPSNYFQTDLSDFWIDENFVHSYPDSALSCFHFRDTFAGEPEGEFCELAKFTAVKNNGVWEYDYLEMRYGAGSFNRGAIQLDFAADPPGHPVDPPRDALSLKGRVIDQAGNKLLFTDQATGRQMILIPGKNNGCSKAYPIPGSCLD
jgi:hypothetical protein